MPNARDILASASAHLRGLAGHAFEVLTISKPISPDAAINLSKVVSKLSPFLGNVIEINTVELLNRQPEYRELGKWKRQDPGFPDIVFEAPTITPTPGFEIKAWFPLATEMTARFKDSQNRFKQDQTDVCVLAWLPSQLIFGTPCIIDVCIVSARSMAEARDTHYHNPPDYLVLEPRDTTSRTRNLQQTNTNGFKWQDDNTPEQLSEARALVASWGEEGKRYKPTSEYQALLSQLTGRYTYRGDTNFAKADRNVHSGIEEFKKRVFEKTFQGRTIAQWGRLFRAKKKATALREALAERFDIREEDIGEILE